jgi:5-methylcytosine-specific restriction endonuclease McrA
VDLLEGSVAVARKPQTDAQKQQACIRAKKWKLANPERARENRLRWAQSERGKAFSRRSVSQPNKERRAAQARARRAANPERYKDLQRRYDAKRREQQKEKQRIRRKEKYEQILEYNRKWYADNSDRARERGRKLNKQYRTVSPDKKKQCDNKWRKANPDKVRAMWLRRRARKAGTSGECSAQQANQRIAMYGVACAYCGGKFEHLDHVIPLSKGGSNWPANFRPSCAKCNKSKGSKTLAAWKREPYTLTTGIL